MNSYIAVFTSCHEHHHFDHATYMSCYIAFVYFYKCNKGAHGITMFHIMRGIYNISHNEEREVIQ